MRKMMVPALEHRLMSRPDGLVQRHYRHDIMHVLDNANMLNLTVTERSRQSKGTTCRIIRFYESIIIFRTVKGNWTRNKLELTAILNQTVPIRRIGGRLIPQTSAEHGRCLCGTTVTRTRLGAGEPPPRHRKWAKSEEPQAVVTSPNVRDGTCMLF